MPRAAPLFAAMLAIGGALGEAAVTCPDATWVYDAVADRCYKDVGRGTHRACSKEWCPRFHASLVCIRSAASNKLVADLFHVTERYWIGLYRDPALPTSADTWQEGWQWSNGCESTYNNFRVGEPNNFCQQEHCAASYGDPRWTDSSCGLNLSCVCEFPSNATEQYSNAALPTYNCKFSGARQALVLSFWCVCPLIALGILLPRLRARLSSVLRHPCIAQAQKQRDRTPRAVVVAKGVVFLGGWTAVVVAVLLHGNIAACSHVATASTVSSLMAALLTALLILRRSEGGSSDYGRRYLATLVFQFVLALARAWSDGVLCKFGGPELVIFRDFTRVSIVLQWPLLDSLVIYRATALANNLGWSTWARCLSRLWTAEALLATVFPYFHLMNAFPKAPLEGEELKLACIAGMFAALLVHLIFSLFFVIALIAALRPLRAAAGTPWGEQRRLALTRCHRTAWLQAAAMVSQALIQTLSAFMYAGEQKNIAIFGETISDFLPLAGFADDFTNILMIVAMSGLTGGVRFSPEARRLRQALRHSLLARQATTDLAGASCEDAGWCDVVADLASRGFTLEQLLVFYKVTLPGRMPHFEPSLHRTVDVVRLVVIPESASSRCACAEHMMNGARKLPSTMVTHNWSNLFRDLVAAIVADALGEPTFILIAHMLDHDFARLEQLLTPAMYDRTYWVCAFSVDQHSAICDQVWESDPVTGSAHPTCECGKAKLGSLTEPLSSSGKSIPCEMNKFDDMMAFLAKNYGLRHVVAVDRNFQLFTRAWCVAEIARGHTLGLLQELKISSFSELGAKKPTLKDLDIRNMQATRPEDVQEILANIPDVSKFNSHMQEMLFGAQGLVMALEASDALQQIECIGKMARLARVLGPLSAAAASAQVWANEEEVEVDVCIQPDVIPGSLP